MSEQGRGMPGLPENPESSSSPGSGNPSSPGTGRTGRESGLPGAGYGPSNCAERPADLREASPAGYGRSLDAEPGDTDDAGTERSGPSDGDIMISADDTLAGPSAGRTLREFTPVTVDEADEALVNGLISLQEYCRALVSVEPLVDTLADADDQVRKNATFELKKRGGRRAVKLLEQALEDESEEVRLFAAEALEKLDSMYNEAINGLISRIRRKPSARLHFLLGKVYFDYALKGMYDPGMRTIYLEKALREFEHADELCSGGERLVHDFLGSVCYELGRYEEAMSWFERVEKAGAADPGLMIRKAAVRFAQGRYGEVESICRWLKRHGSSGEDEYGDIVDLWS